MEWIWAQDYWLARLLLLRAVGAVYLLGFIVVVNQFRPLLGEHGLLPAPDFLRHVSFRQAPSLFVWRYSDRLLLAVGWTGIALSAAVVVGAVEQAPLWASTLVWLVLWALYLSVVNIGQTFYAFGWESLLLETGFYCAFLGTADVAPPLPVLLVLRWLLFRLEFGAGLIKLRGDRCWRDLTCLYYHHQTQPLPNRLSWYFHHLPKPLHRAEVAGNHIAQLIVPFALFLPQPFAAAAGVVIVVTQGWLVLSGNFSWLNAMAIVLAFAAFDDTALGWLPVSAPAELARPTAFAFVVLGLLALVAVLSYQPTRNLLSRRQMMNASFNAVHLVNTYGAFGSITRDRYEIVIEGTDAEDPEHAVWREYEFKGKPGDPRRPPRQIAPYHLRLDWLLWFAALSPSYARRWFPPLVDKLLHNDAPTLRLLARNPFPDEPPTLIRARLYRYRFTTRAQRRESGAWWVRTLAGEFLRPVGSLSSARRPGRPQ